MNSLNALNNLSAHPGPAVSAQTASAILVIANDNVCRAEYRTTALDVLVGLGLLAGALGCVAVTVAVILPIEAVRSLVRRVG